MNPGLRLVGLGKLGLRSVQLVIPGLQLELVFPACLTPFEGLSQRPAGIAVHRPAAGCLAFVGVPSKPACNVADGLTTPGTDQLPATIRALHSMEARAHGVSKAAHDLQNKK